MLEPKSQPACPNGAAAQSPLYPDLSDTVGNPGPFTVNLKEVAAFPDDTTLVVSASRLGPTNIRDPGWPCGPGNPGPWDEIPTGQ